MAPEVIQNSDGYNEKVSPELQKYIESISLHLIVPFFLFPVLPCVSLNLNPFYC